jgi:hypothetical protein
MRATDSDGVFRRATDPQGETIMSTSGKTKWATAVLGAGLLISGSAWADQQTYPGSLCRSAAKDSADFPVLETVTREGRVENRSLDTMVVICPIVRDLSTFIGGGSMTEIWVMDHDEAAGAGHDVRCRALTRYPGGSPDATPWQSTANHPAHEWVDLTIFGPVNQHQSGDRFIECEIPAQIKGAKASTVIQYLSSEL